MTPNTASVINEPTIPENETGFQYGGSPPQRIDQSLPLDAGHEAPEPRQETITEPTNIKKINRSATWNSQQSNTSSVRFSAPQSREPESGNLHRDRDRTFDPEKSTGSFDQKWVKQNVLCLGRSTSFELFLPELHHL